MKSIKSIVLFVCFLLLIASAFFQLNSYASSDFPSKTVNIVTGASPGSGLHNLLSKQAQYLQKTLGVPVMVDSREGANHMIAYSHVARSKPDGYTLIAVPVRTLAGHDEAGTLQVVDYTKFNWFAGSNVLKHGIFSAPDNIKDFDDLISRKRVIFGDRGYESSSVLMMGDILETFGVPFTFIPGYDTGGMYAAVLNHELDFVVRPYGTEARNMVLDGKLQAIATLNAERDHGIAVPCLPELAAKYNKPEIAEPKKIKTYGSYTMYGAPPGTPDDVLNALQEAFKKALTNDEYLKFLNKIGITPLPIFNRDELGDIVRAFKDIKEVMDVDRLRDLAIKSGQ